MRTRSGGLAAVILMSLSIGIAVPAFAEAASPVAPAASPAAPTSPLEVPAPGTAHIRTTGMVESDMVLPLQAAMTAATDSGYDLRFRDDALDTLNISLTVTNGTVSDAFVAVGVPGTTIDEPSYFADFLHTDCVVDVSTLDATGVTGTIDCTDLSNGEGSGSVSLQAAFSTGAIGAPTASAPSAPSASPLEAPATGTAHIRTTGMVESDMVLPVRSDMTAATDSGYDLQFQDATRDTLNVTLTVADGTVTDAFVAVGVPGTSIFDASYFADFLAHPVHRRRDDARGDRCGGHHRLHRPGERGRYDAGTISLQATFSTGVIASGCAVRFARELVRRGFGAPPIGSSVHDQRYGPGCSRYPGRVSGPQLAVPTPRWAASRWTTADVRGLELLLVIGGGQVGRPIRQHRDLAWHVERDPQAGTGLVRQLQPADLGVATVLLGPDVGHHLSRHVRFEPSDPGQLPVGIRLVGSGTEPGDTLAGSARPPGRSRPAAGRRASRGSPRTPRPGCDLPAAACSWSRGAPRRPNRSRPRRARRRHRRPSARCPPSVRSQRREAPLLPCRDPCRRCGRCRLVPGTATTMGRPTTADAPGGRRRRARWPAGRPRRPR